MPQELFATRQDWPRIQMAARVTTRDHIRSWQNSVAIQGGQVNGSTLTLLKGCLVRSQSLEHELIAALLPATASTRTAQGWAKAAGEAWRRWLEGYHVTSPGAYPDFLAFPGHYAPPTPNIPFPLAIGSSLTEPALLQNNLHQAIKDAISSTNYNEPNAASAVQDFATWLSSSFYTWRMTLMMHNIMGEGPIPVWASPFVPVGPVVNGKAWANPGFLVGLPFPD